MCTGSARHLETWNTPGYLFGIFQDLENLEKLCFSLKYKITPGKQLKFAAICDHVAHSFVKKYTCLHRHFIENLLSAMLYLFLH